MTFSKHLPLAILILILCSAVAVLVLGIRFAKEEKVVVIQQDRAPLSNFTTQLLGEVNSLETLYQNHLLGVRDTIGRRINSVKIYSLCRRIIGVEQATVFREGNSPFSFDIREGDRQEVISRPRRSGDTSSDEGIVIDTAMFSKEALGVDFRWLNQPGYPPHFVARIDYQTILVLRINQEYVTAAADSWLAEWVPKNFDQVEVAGIPTVLKNPAGQVIASTAKTDTEIAPDMILPIPSVLGNWKISSWALKETVTSYRQPVLIGSAALAVVLAFAGFFGYAQQQRATRLAEQRVSFVNRVSHELRTPMTNILLNVDLLSDSFVEDNSPQSKRLGLIREEASRLSRLLENVLTFSEREKLRANPKQNLQIIPCDIDELIDEILSQFAPTLARKNIVVHHDKSLPPAFAFADPDACKQIISNLISNVEKYAADGGKLEIETASSLDEITISIIDFGPGIPKSEARRIFRPFVRLNDSTTEGVSGTGLGLAIARDLTESMNGKLELFSQGTGCRFNLTLPLAADNIVSIAS